MPDDCDDETPQDETAQAETQKFTGPHVVFAEGDADLNFLNALAETYGITGFQFFKHRPLTGDPETGNNFRQRLELLRIAVETFDARVETLLLVRDSNSRPGVAFTAVRDQIAGVGGLGVPERKRHIVAPNDQRFPSVAVLTLPWDNRKGNLETLLNEALADHYPDEWKHVMRLHSETVAKREPAWSESKQSKMLFACMIAVVCKCDPSCAASHMWHSDKKLRHLLNYPGFKPVADFLAEVASAGPSTVPI